MNDIQHYASMVSESSLRKELMKDNTSKKRSRPNPAMIVCSMSSI